MHIELTVDGTRVETIRRLAHLADSMSRLRPGQAICLESDGTERFLADRIEALARRRQYRVAWEQPPTERSLRFALEPSTLAAGPAPAERPVEAVELAETKPEDAGAGVAAGPAGADRAAAHVAGRLDAAPSSSSESPAPQAGEPTTVSPEGEVVPLFGPRRGRPPRWLIDARNAYLRQQASQ